MKPVELSRLMFETECLAINAQGVMPRRSKYRHWCDQLIAGELPAYRWPALRKRLVEYKDDNGLV